MRTVARVLVTAAVLAGCATAPSAPVPTPTPDPGLPGRLVADVTGDGAFRHLEELQRIADANGGTRALGTPGYDASVEYVAGVLRTAGYQVETPTFTISDFTVQEQRLSVDGAEVETLALGFS